MNINTSWIRVLYVILHTLMFNNNPQNNKIQRRKMYNKHILEDTQNREKKRTKDI